MKNFYTFFLLFLIVIIIGCTTQNTSNNDSSVINQPINEIDKYAKLISASETNIFEEIEKKEFYKIYQKATITNWNSFYAKQLAVIINWSKANNLTDDQDTTTVFYPFSGPDLPFVYAFYPYAKKYIFVGLEDLGKIFEIDKASDLEIERYLNAISLAVSDYLLYGFFSTNNLKKSFLSPEMNGTIHPLLFFSARLGYNIKSFRYFYIDDCGKINYFNKLDPLNKYIKGFELTLQNANDLRKVYYLQFDLSNQNFQKHPEFYCFISNFGYKNIFIKSASYLLHQEDFSMIKNLILSQFLKIIQDDSGIKFSDLKQKNYLIQLFGNYKTTINMFKKYFQKDLKEEYEKQKPKILPFRFGYNIPFDQTTIMFIKKANTPINYPFYSVQFKMSWSRLNEDSLSKFIPDLDYYFEQNYYKYISGKFKTLEEAINHKNYLKSLGYSDCFIIYLTDSTKTIINEN